MLQETEHIRDPRPYCPYLDPATEKLLDGNFVIGLDAEVVPEIRTQRNLFFAVTIGVLIVPRFKAKYSFKLSLIAKESLGLATDYILGKSSVNCVANNSYTCSGNATDDLLGQILFACDDLHGDLTREGIPQKTEEMFLGRPPANNKNLCNSSEMCLKALEMINGTFKAYFGFDRNCNCWK
jgi:hypothetical protein